MIVLDTSVLVGALTGESGPGHSVRRMVADGVRFVVPSVVLFEWLRGPRTDDELQLQRALFPDERALPFGSAEADEAAALYRSHRRPRGREVDLMIAAHAITSGSPLWTLNRKDFTDIAGLELVPEAG